MLYKFNINHNCKGDECSIILQDKIETYLEQKINLDGHISIYHKPNNHTIWLFLYDKKGKHESESVGKIEIQDSTITKKWTGKTPILSKLKGLF